MKGKTNFELRPLVVSIARSQDRSTVHFDKSLHKSESNAESALRVLQPPIQLREHVEDGLQIALSYSNAVVYDLHPNFGARQLHGDTNVTAGARILPRVVQQITEDLA